jgi:hypothetical protein
MNSSIIWTTELASHFRNFFEAGFTLYSYILSVYFSVVDYVAYYFLTDEEKFLLDVQESLEEEKADYVRFYDEFVPYVLDTIESVQSTFVMIGVWFAAFLLVFSHSVQPTASNEYLLFGCIMFTLFAVYGQLSAGLGGTVAPAVEAIQADASRRMNWATDVNVHYDATVEGHHTDLDAVEQLSVAGADEVDEPTEADDVIVEQALTTVATQSLQNAVSEELAEELMEEVIEDLDTGEAAVEELLDELAEEAALDRIKVYFEI